MRDFSENDYNGAPVVNVDGQKISFNFWRLTTNFRALWRSMSNPSYYFLLLFSEDVVFQRQHVKDHFAPKHSIEIMHVIKE